MSELNRLHLSDDKPIGKLDRLGLGIVYLPGTTLEDEILHVGILFRRTEGDMRDVMFLHLRSHYDLACTRRKRDLAWLDISLDPEIKTLLAQLCEVIEKMYTEDNAWIDDDDEPNEPTGPRLAFAFRYGDGHFDPRSGDFLCSDGNGLTCATFVLAVFASHGIQVLHTGQWEPRAEDEAVQRGMISQLRTAKGRRRPTDAQIRAIETEIGCARFRPEEVAASGTSDVLPLGFRDAAHIGERIARQLRDRAARDQARHS